MPVYRNHRVVEIARGLKAFLRFDVGVVRGELPDPEGNARTRERSRGSGKPRKAALQNGRRPGRKGGQAAGANGGGKPKSLPEEPSYEAIYESHIEARSADVAIGRRSFEAIGRLELALLQQEGLKPTDTLVDLGCGTGRLAVHVIPTLIGGRYVGIDIAQTVLDEARERVEKTIPDPPCSVSWVHQTEPAFALDDDSVDMICAFSVINHMEHEDAYSYLKDALLVVRPGGRFVFSCLPLNTKRAREVFLKVAQMDLQTRHRTVRHVATSKEFMSDIARLAGWTPLRWYDGDEANIQLPDGELQNFGQSICVLEAPHEGETDGADGTAS